MRDEHRNEINFFFYFFYDKCDRQQRDGKVHQKKKRMEGRRDFVIRKLRIWEDEYDKCGWTFSSLSFLDVAACFCHVGLFKKNITRHLNDNKKRGDSKECILSENWQFCNWWRLKLSNFFPSVSIPHCHKTFIFFPSSSIFYPWMHEKVPAKCIEIHIDFLYTITVIFLPFFPSLFWCYMLETVPLWWAHWICSCSDCQLEVMRYIFCVNN